MDVVFEFLVQAVLQVLGELVLDLGFEWAFDVLRHQVGRAIIGAFIGLVFGLTWGDHLSGEQHYPKLLWVSLALGLLALVQTIRWRDAPRHDDLLTLPWHWSAWRAGSFVAMNTAIASGILIAFTPGVPLR